MRKGEPDVGRNRRPNKRNVHGLCAACKKARRPTHECTSATCTCDCHLTIKELAEKRKRENK